MRKLNEEVEIKILNLIANDPKIKSYNLLRVCRSWSELFHKDPNLKCTYEVWKRAALLLSLSQWQLPKKSLKTIPWYKDLELSYGEENSDDADPVQTYLEGKLNFIFDGHYDVQVIRHLKAAYPKYFSAEKIAAPLWRCS